MFRKMLFCLLDKLKKYPYLWLLFPFIIVILALLTLLGCIEVCVEEFCSWYD